MEILIYSILVVGVVTLLVVIASLVGRGRQAYQLEEITKALQYLDRSFGDETAKHSKLLRDEVNARLDALGKSQEQRLDALAERLREIGKGQGEDQQKFRDLLDTKMKELREENSAKLDQMRKTVDEQLQTALEKRLTESFKTVSERLESVHKGLGEMQVLAGDVGSLKRVLTNVKSRGGFGETQLAMLIEDFLGADQFVTNYDCGKASGGERVEFGIRVPGTEKDVYLPVDAKFHREDYERLLDAHDQGDAAATKKASDDLERAIIKSAKDISSKYINPPFTTEWAILFVPTEGLYAEILRRPGLFEKLQREYSVTVAGPTNLQVMLSTFRMGFRQLVLQDRANDVWDVLGAVKREFENYGAQIQAMSKNLDAAQNHVAKLDTRKNAMLRALKGVETLGEDQAKQLIDDGDDLQ